MDWRYIYSTVRQENTHDFRPTFIPTELNAVKQIQPIHWWIQDFLQVMEPIQPIFCIFLCQNESIGALGGSTPPLYPPMTWFSDSRFFFQVITWPVSAFIPGSIPEWLYNLSSWAAYVNSGINPFLYLFSSRDFRTGCARVFTRFWK